MEIIKHIGNLLGWLLTLALIILVIGFIGVRLGAHLKKKMIRKRLLQPTDLQPTEGQQRMQEIDMLERDFRDIKEKILLEAHRLIETYEIDPKYYYKIELFERFVHTLQTHSGNDHDFITLHLGNYSYQFWERGQCNCGFDGATEEEFVKQFLMYLFFNRCRACYMGHYLCMDFPGNKETDKQICCTDILTGYQCYANTSREAEMAMKQYIDTL